MKLRQLADILGAELSTPSDVDIVGVASVHDAAEGQITFIIGKQYLADLESSHASAALVPLDMPDMAMPVLRVQNPRLAFARTLELFHVAPYRAKGISEKACIGTEVTIGKDPSIHPLAVVDDHANIGDRVTVYPGAYIGIGSSIGDDSVIHANVTIGNNISIGKRVIIHAGTVLGSDGFGFVTDGGRHHKIPQVGGVIVEDDVEIGGNCTIDRATMGNTLIKQGSKLDNQVHIAHNVTIGEHCLLAGQVGIAGSSTLGDYVVFGGQVGVADHTVVGDRVMAGGQAGITKDVAPNQMIAGNKAMPLRDWLKVQAVLPKLPELKKRIADLERMVQELRNGKKAG